MSKRAHITTDQVDQISKLLASGMSQSAAARAADISQQSVSRIAKGLLKGRRVPPPKEKSHADAVETNVPAGR